MQQPSDAEEHPWRQTQHSTSSFPQGLSYHLKSMGKHRMVKEVHTFIAITATHGNIVRLIFNHVIIQEYFLIFAASIN